MPTRILIEGRPGSGKTTAIRRLAALLHTREAAGFTTEEIRAGGARAGFALETLDGRRAVLAHVSFPGPPQVGRYGVDLRVMAELALPSLPPLPSLPAPPSFPEPPSPPPPPAAPPVAPPVTPPRERLVLIDELGRMELAYPPFRDAVQALFAAGVDVVATVQAQHGPLTDALKRRPDVELIRLTPANRDALPARLAARLEPAGH
ncbi:nucleoside-triphosphatase [Kitasatospora sp. NPDC047058]|uniref:nucleoside-triphosphatase n=1 Tax=Kitasatospora sp. NPDC047058 TaxID=3155620 RepID=UPI0034101CF3